MRQHLHRSDPRRTPMCDEALLTLVETLNKLPENGSILICCSCLAQLIARLMVAEQELEMTQKFTGVLQ